MNTETNIRRKYIKLLIQLIQQNKNKSEELYYLVSGYLRNSK